MDEKWQAYLTEVFQRLHDAYEGARREDLALLGAVHQDDGDLVKECVQYGADPNAYLGGMYVLGRAKYYDKKNAYDALVECGAQSDLENRPGDPFSRIEFMDHMGQERTYN